MTTTPLTEHEIHEAHQWLQSALHELKRVIVGQTPLLERLLIAVISQGHVLVEGAPGLAKTLALKSMAQLMQVAFKRIQFTPDLLPSDLIGTRLFNPTQGTFSTETGPLFAQFILADEINRAPAKVQSALLEAMQERQVTIGKETFALTEPFLVMATQNPIEAEGTYPLPEAQLDRFLFKILVDYPSHDEELLILERVATQGLPQPQALLDVHRLNQLVHRTQQVFIEPAVASSIVNLVQATRTHFPKWIQYGASPRGTLALATASRGLSLLQGRGYVTLEDVWAVAKDCLRHRLVLTYDALAEGKTADHLLDQLIDRVQPHVVTSSVL